MGNQLLYANIIRIAMCMTCTLYNVHMCYIYSLPSTNNVINRRLSSRNTVSYAHDKIANAKIYIFYQFKWVCGEQLKKGNRRLHSRRWNMRILTILSKSPPSSCFVYASTSACSTANTNSKRHNNYPRTCGQWYIINKCHLKMNFSCVIEKKNYA